METGCHYKNGARSILLFTLMLLTSAVATFAQTSVHIGPRPNNYSDPANGIYVSPTGNDATADGSIGKPYKSINTALGKAQPGATIILRSGTYREGRRVRIQKSNITIKSAKGEWAIIDLTTYDAGNNEHSGVEFYAEDQVTGGIVSGCKLQCVEVKGGYYAVCFETKWDWGKPDRRGASDNIVEDCILHHSTDDVVKVKPNCVNNIIRYNEIHHSGQAHINHPDYPTGQRNAEGIDNVNGDKMHVHNNYIHDICSNGIYAKGGATDVLIENNRVERINGAGIALGFDTSPEYFDIAVNPHYYENIRGVVCNNLIMDTGWEGIGLYASKDAQVYNNTLVNVAKLGMFSRSAIYFGIVTQDWKPHQGRPDNVNPTIHHNIVSQPAGNTMPMIEIRLDNNSELGVLSGLSGSPTMNNNCYYIAGKSATFTDNRPGGIKNAGLAAWKTHISGESGTIEANPSLNANFISMNTQCAGMGIKNHLDMATGTGAPTFLREETFVYICDGTLHIDNQAIETVQVYAMNGTLLNIYRKPEGKAVYSVVQPKGTMLIIGGSSGWSKQLIVQ